MKTGDCPYLDPLDEVKIRAKLRLSRLVKNIVILRETSSTNDAAWRYAAKTGGLAVLAEYQYAGRGRRHRKWHSPVGGSLLCSVLIPSGSIIESVGLAAAVAAAQSIESLCGLCPQIKWPNDIMINGKKIAGILVESKKLSDGPACVIGIGVNVHQKSSSFESLDLETPATSLDIETGSFADRNELAAALLESLEYWLDAAAQDRQSVVDAWLLRNRQIGKRIAVESDGRQYAGTCIGIDPIEGLIVQIDRGPVKIFSAAQTTVIKNSG